MTLYWHRPRTAWRTAKGLLGTHNALRLVKHAQKETRTPASRALLPSDAVRQLTLEDVKSVTNASPSALSRQDKAVAAHVMDAGWAMDSENGVDKLVLEALKHPREISREEAVFCRARTWLDTQRGLPKHVAQLEATEKASGDKRAVDSRDATLPEVWSLLNGSTIGAILHICGNFSDVPDSKRDVSFLDLGVAEKLWLAVVKGGFRDYSGTQFGPGVDPYTPVPFRTTGSATASVIPPPLEGFRAMMRRCQDLETLERTVAAARSLPRNLQSDVSLGWRRPAYPWTTDHVNWSLLDSVLAAAIERGSAIGQHVPESCSAAILRWCHAGNSFVVITGLITVESTHYLGQQRVAAELSALLSREHIANLRAWQARQRRGGTANAEQL